MTVFLFAVKKLLLDALTFICLVQTNLFFNIIHFHLIKIFLTLTALYAAYVFTFTFFFNLSELFWTHLQRFEVVKFVVIYLFLGLLGASFPFFLLFTLFLCFSSSLFGYCLCLGLLIFILFTYNFEFGYICCFRGQCFNSCLS